MVINLAIVVMRALPSKAPLSSTKDVRHAYEHWSHWCGIDHAAERCLYDRSHESPMW
jgi:hypothetical protein